MSKTLEEIALQIGKEVFGAVDECLSGQGERDREVTAGEYPIGEGCIEFARRLVAALGAQEPDGWIDGEGDPYCQHGWGKKPPEGWTTCEENSYPVFRVQKPAIQDNTSLTELLAQEREKVIALYSPDDTAQDWIDKIRSMK